MYLYLQISWPKIYQIAQIGGVLRMSEPADSKTDPGFENCPRVEGNLS